MLGIVVGSGGSVVGRDGLVGSLGRGVFAVGGRVAVGKFGMVGRDGIVGNVGCVG